MASQATWLSLDVLPEERVVLRHMLVLVVVEIPLQAFQDEQALRHPL